MAGTCRISGKDGKRYRMRSNIINEAKFDKRRKQRELENVIISRDDCMTSVGIYLGSFSELSRIDNGMLPWNHSEPTELDSGDYLTLGEIEDFFRENGNPYRLITVFVNGPQKGKVYQYGNYGDIWYEAGTLKGYC